MPLMAAFSVGHSLQTTRVPNMRPKGSLLHCRSHLSTEPSESGEEKTKKNEEKRKKVKRWFNGGLSIADLSSEPEKIGRRLKENLSPKEKGDWKDVMLMSLSFSVYVYISQKIVCAYCAWISMINHS